MPRPPAGATGLGASTSRSTRVDTQIEGSKIFVVTKLVDIGYLTNRFDVNPEAEPMRSLVVHGVFEHGGVPVEAASDERLSFDPRANMVKYLTAARGGGEPADDEVVDFGEIVGRPVQVSVKSVPVRDGNGFWLRLSAPTALIEGTPIPECLAAYVAAPDIAREPFRWLNEEQLAQVKRKLGPERQVNGGANEQRPPATGPTAIAIPGSQITNAGWEEPAKVLRRVLDGRFHGDISLMYEYFQREMSAGDPIAVDVLGFMGVRESDEHIVFRFAGRSDADAKDLGDALVKFEKSGPPKKEAPAAGAPAAAAPDEPAPEGPGEPDESGEVDPDDLPF